MWLVERLKDWSKITEFWHKVAHNTNINPNSHMTQNEH